jgi:hypothetical protein
MNPSPAFSCQPTPTGDACEFAAAVIRSTAADEYSKDTDGDNPAYAGGNANGTDHRNDPSFSDTFHFPDADNDVAAKFPASLDNPSVVDAAATAANDPPVIAVVPNAAGVAVGVESVDAGTTVPVGDADTNNVTTCRATSFVLSTTTPEPHRPGDDATSAAAHGHARTRNRWAQSPPNKPANAE